MKSVRTSFQRQLKTERHQEIREPFYSRFITSIEAAAQRLLSNNESITLFPIILSEVHSTAGWPGKEKKVDLKVNITEHHRKELNLFLYDCYKYQDTSSDGSVLSSSIIDF